MANTAAKPIVNRQQKRVIRTRRKLKAAALDVFSEKGINAATVADITEKADLGKGTLYQHFEDKNQIVVSVVDDAACHLMESISDYRTQPETIEEMLEHLLDAHLGFSRNFPEEFLLLFQGNTLVKLQSDHLDELEEPYLRYLEAIELELSSYLSFGIDPSKVRRLSCAVAGFVFGFLSFAMIGMTEDQIEDSVKSLKRVFVGSLKAFLGR